MPSLGRWFFLLLLFCFWFFVFFEKINSRLCREKAKQKQKTLKHFLMCKEIIYIYIYFKYIKLPPKVENWVFEFPVGILFSFVSEKMIFPYYFFLCENQPILSPEDYTNWLLLRETWTIMRFQATFPSRFEKSPPPPSLLSSELSLDD